MNGILIASNGANHSRVMKMAEEQLEMRKLAESIAKEISVMATESKWATRFVWAAIIQGALVSALTGILVIGEIGFLHPPVSLLINATVPGIWIALGYFAYLIVGVLGMAVTALFYQYLEVNLKSPYQGPAKTLAGLHLVLGNIGIVGATCLVIYAGYITGVATLSSSLGGLSMALGDAEAMIKSQFLMPIAGFTGMTLLGIVLGGLGYVLVFRARPKPQV